jgi:DNA-binding CsgD family transcriptional regulator
MFREYRGLLSPQGRLLHANQAALDLIGADMEDVARMYAWETPWHDGPERDLVRKMIRDCANGDGDQLGEVTLHLPTGPLKTTYSVRARLNRTRDKLIALLPGADRIGSRILTEKERVALSWTAMGKTAGEVATIIGVSRRTVEYYLGEVRRKLHTTNVTHSIAVAVKAGIIVIVGAGMSGFGALIAIRQCHILDLIGPPGGIV